MKYIIGLRWSKETLVETNDLEMAKSIAEMLYKKYNGQHVIFIDEKQDWTSLVGRFSYDGYKDYER